MKKSNSYDYSKDQLSVWCILYHIFIWSLFFILLVGSAIYEGGPKAANSNISLFGEKPAAVNTKNASKTPEQNGNGMMFTENKGQYIDAEGKSRPDILFKGDGGGMEVYLRRSGLSYVLTNIKQVMHEVEEEAEELEESGKLTEEEEMKVIMDLFSKEKIKTHRIDMDFLNCNNNYQIISSEKVGGQSHYYYSHCKDGITNVNSYNLVELKNLYNNIDVKYYGGKANGLKYDIIVNPGGNPSDIKLSYKGTHSIKLIKGKLQVETTVGSLGEYMPKVYQIINNQVVDVKTEYVLTYNNNSGTDATVSFKLSNYNSNYPLVIDPWVTYFGGVSVDQSCSVATDALGNCIVSGLTGSANFPATAGAGYFTFQAGFGGNNDVTLVKFNSLGLRLFATYIGGAFNEIPGGVTCDANNNIIFTGTTWSNNFPIGSIGANVVHQAAYSGNGDSFLFKLDPTGVRLFSTFYGGVNADDGMDVCTNGSDIYIIGYTSSATNISTGGAFQMVMSGPNDCYVAKFLANGTRVWGTYFGGASTETGLGITCDPVGNVLFTGYTRSANLPILGASQPIHGGAGSTDSYVAKMTSNGNLVWSTFNGGNNWDYGYAICTDALGNVYVGGQTYSGNAIATVGVYQSVISAGANGDAFVVKYDPNGVKLWGTYLGGNGGDYCTGIACDLNSGNVVTMGDTYSANFPTTSCSYQINFMGTEDQWLTTLTPNGTSLVCSSYIGIGNAASPNNETMVGRGGSLAVKDCNAYMVAYSQCNYPVTAGAWQTVCGGNSDGVISQLSLLTCGLPSGNILQFSATPTLCVGQSTAFTPTISNICNTVAITYTWSFQGGSPSTSILQSPTITYNTPGTYSVQLKVSYSCGKDSLIKLNYINVVANPTLSFPAGSFTNSCGGNGAASVSVAPMGIYTFSWSNGATTQTANNLAPGIYTVTVANTTGCSSTATVQIINSPSFSATTSFTNNSSCLMPNGVVTASPSVLGTYSYSWSTGSTLQTLSNLNTGVYTVTLTDINTGCTTTQTVTINTTTIAPNILVTPPSSLTCINTSVTLVGTSTTSGVSYSWSPQNVSTNTAIATAAGNYTLIVTDPISGCTANTVVSVSQSTTVPNISATIPPTLTCLTTSVVLTGNSTTGGVTFTWQPQNVSTNTAVATSAGNYSFTVTDPLNGCTSTTVVSVIQNGAFPNISIIQPATLTCLTTSVTLIGNSTTSGVTYSWSPQNVNTNTAIATSSGNYTFVVTDPLSGCISTSVVSVVQDTVAPNISATASNSLNCILNSTTLTATSSNTSIVFVWNGGSLSNAVNPAVVSAPGNYSVTATNPNNGCTTASVVTILQSTLAPDISISSTGNISCGAPSATLTGSSLTSGATFLWIPQNVTTNTAIATIAGTYTLIVADPTNGCTSLMTIGVTSTPMFTANIAILNQINCFGDNTGALQINNQGGGSAPFTVANLTTSNTIGNITSFPVSLNNLSAGSYTIEVIDNNGCKQTLKTTINQPSSLSALLSGNTNLCLGQNASISSTVSGGTVPYVYHWSPTGGNTPNLNTSPNTTTIFTLTVTDNNGCQTQVPVQIVVDAAPTASISNSSISGCAPVCAGFSLSTPQNAAYTYQWLFTNNATGANTISPLYNPNYCFNQTGSYNVSISITTSLGCVTNVNYTNLINVYPKPIADFSFDPQKPNIIDQPMVYFTNQSTGATGYGWYTSTQQFSNQQNSSYIFENPGRYSIYLVASNGMCTDTAVKIITVDDEFIFYAPNSFTPNKDNLNDFFFPRVSGYKEGTYTLHVFDRWGELLFTSHEPIQGWNGFYKNELCKDDVYVWKVSVDDKKSKNHQFTGHVTLLK